MEPIVKIYTYLNTENSHATYYKIAEFVIQNNTDIATISISQISEKTFVSKATITRFVHYFGFENYRSFRDYFKKINAYSRMTYFKLDTLGMTQIKDHPSDFLKEQANCVIHAIQDTAQTMDIHEIDKLILSFREAKKVAFLGYSDSNIIAKDIQLSCIGIKKTVDIAESRTKLHDIIERYDDKDLIIILSNYGNFFKHYNEYYQVMLSKNIPIILITQNYASMDSFRLKQTIYLTSERRLNVGNYPLRLFAEYFVRRLFVTQT